LPNGGALDGVAVGRDVLDFQAYQVAAAKLAVDGEIEQGKVAHLALHLQPGPDRPNMLGLQWRSRANKLGDLSAIAA